MKKIICAAAALLMLAGAGAAYAGVVVDEQQTVDHGDGKPVSHSRTVMIQGNKQKSVMEGGSQTIVTDLDNGTMTMINAQRKSYVEMPFPPTGQMAAMMQTQGASSMSFKKTGTHQTIAGYRCDDYIGDGNMGASKVSVKGCFSKTAPGAADFTAFQKKMAAKTKGTPMAMMGQVPDGVPLKIDSTSKITHVAMPPGMSPDQAAKINDMLAKRPPTVTHMTVTKVRTEKLAAASFAPPVGYQKQEMRMPGMGMGGMSKPGAGSGTSPSNKVAE
jgi:hypothetical protein